MKHTTKHSLSLFLILSLIFQFNISIAKKIKDVEVPLNQILQEADEELQTFGKVKDIFSTTSEFLNEKDQKFLNEYFSESLDAKIPSIVKTKNGFQYQVEGHKFNFEFNQSNSDVLVNGKKITIDSKDDLETVLGKFEAVLNTQKASLINFSLFPQAQAAEKKHKGSWVKWLLIGLAVGVGVWLFSKMHKDKKQLNRGISETNHMLADPLFTDGVNSDEDLEQLTLLEERLMVLENKARDARFGNKKQDKLLINIESVRTEIKRLRNAYNNPVDPETDDGYGRDEVTGEAVQ